jgi:hypothetical protein
MLETRSSPSTKLIFFLPSANLLTFLVIKTLDPDLDRQPKTLDLDQMDMDPKDWFIYFFY